ncbi:hypothetical protein ABZP36_023848 [Zizania latifolia]
MTTTDRSGSSGTTSSPAASSASMSSQFMFIVCSCLTTILLIEISVWKQVQNISVERQKCLSQGPLGDAGELELTKGHLSEELANIPVVGQTSGVLVCKDDGLEAVREELIKGFLEIDSGGRKLGIKEMGELNEKAFHAACLAKLPPEEAGSASYELYSSWQQRLSDLSWNPFKTVTVDGNCKEIVNVDDDKLQELKRAWGEGAHDAVINALMEMKEVNILGDRSIAYELWNYKEGRKATLSECVDNCFNSNKMWDTKSLLVLIN